MGGANDDAKKKTRTFALALSSERTIITLERKVCAARQTAEAKKNKPPTKNGGSFARWQTLKMPSGKRR